MRFPNFRLKFRRSAESNGESNRSPAALSFVISSLLSIMKILKLNYCQTPKTDVFCPYFSDKCPVRQMFPKLARKSETVA